MTAVTEQIRLVAYDAVRYAWRIYRVGDATIQLNGPILADRTDAERIAEILSCSPDPLLDCSSRPEDD